MKIDMKLFVAVGITFLIWLFTYKSYANNVPFADFAPYPILWILVPGLIGLAIYLLLRGNDSFVERIKQLAAKGEEVPILLEPYQVFERFENVPERIVLGKMRMGDIVRTSDKWIFTCYTEKEGKTFIILNGLKGKPLNPEIISQHELSELGYDDLKDYLRTGKSRLYYDIIKNWSAKGGSATELLGMFDGKEGAA